jgi:hypothetical protein
MPSLFHVLGLLGALEPLAKNAIVGAVFVDLVREVFDEVGTVAFTDVGFAEIPAKLALSLTRIVPTSCEQS